VQGQEQARTPASHSWLNLAKRWFAELTNRKLRQSAHHGVTDLEDDIRRRINEWNKNLKPYTWTRSADEVLETHSPCCERRRRTLDPSHPTGTDTARHGLQYRVQHHPQRRPPDILADKRGRQPLPVEHRPQDRRGDHDAYDRQPSTELSQRRTSHAISI